MFNTGQNSSDNLQQTKTMQPDILDDKFIWLFVSIVDSPDYNSI